MVYTLSKKADRKVAADMEKIKKIIVKRLNPISIVLFGGFGHGEGAFKIEKNQIIPLNDYDMYVVIRRKISDEVLERVGAECSKAINRGGLEFVEHTDKKYDKNKFFHVDIRCITYRELLKMLPTQRTADLKTSKVIYGADMLKKISFVKIPVSDAIRLLFKKFDHFLLAEENTREIRQIYAVKGFTDSCSALLIFYNRYKPTYSERGKEFQKLEMPDEFKKLVAKATKAKTGNFEVAEKDFYEKSKKWTLFTLKHILRKSLRINEEDLAEIIRITYSKLPFVYFAPYLRHEIGFNFFPAQYYLNLKFFMAGLKKKEFLWKNLFLWRDAGIRAALALILYANGFKREAEKYLRTITGRTKPLKERILRMYSLYYLQKLI